MRLWCLTPLSKILYRSDQFYWLRIITLTFMVWQYLPHWSKIWCTYLVEREKGFCFKVSIYHYIIGDLWASLESYEGKEITSILLRFKTELRYLDKIIVLVFFYISMSLTRFFILFCKDTKRYMYFCYTSRAPNKETF